MTMSTPKKAPGQYARGQARRRFTRAIKTYTDQQGVENARVAIQDILADARHYCDTAGLAYHELDRRAHAIYNDERLSK